MSGWGFSLAFRFLFPLKSLVSALESRSSAAPRAVATAGVPIVTGVRALEPASVGPAAVPVVAQAGATLRVGATATPGAKSTARGGGGWALCWALWGALGGGAFGRGLALLLVLLAGHLGRR